MATPIQCEECGHRYIETDVYHDRPDFAPECPKCFRESLPRVWQRVAGEEQSAEMFFPSHGDESLRAYFYRKPGEIAVIYLHTIEELYQAFKERLLQEVKEETNGRS